LLPEPLPGLPPEENISQEKIHKTRRIIIKLGKVFGLLIINLLCG